MSPLAAYDFAAWAARQRSSCSSSEWRLERCLNALAVTTPRSSKATKKARQRDHSNSPAVPPTVLQRIQTPFPPGSSQVALAMSFVGRLDFFQKTFVG